MITICGIKVPYHEISMNEILIANALIKVVSVLQFHAKLYRYSKRNVLAFADNEVKTERVEPCINAQSYCFGGLKRPPIVCSRKLDHYRIFDNFNISQTLELHPIPLDF